MVSSKESADQNVSSDKVQPILNPQRDITLSQGIHDTKIHLSKPEGTRSIPSIVAKNEAKDSDATACALRPDQEGKAHSLSLEKHLHSPETLSHELHLLQSGQDSPSIIREKVSKDGYNWRKYGQKHVKGNEFIRSYYKCTHPNCQAKKQLQQSNNGHITDSVCIGQHNHPKPQSSTILPVDCVLPVVEQGPHKHSFTNVEDKSSIEHGCMPQKIKPLRSIPTSKVCGNDESKAAHSQWTEKDEVHKNEEPESKRLKKDNSNTDIAGVDVSTFESRVVVQTSSEVDFVNDGFRWRKYGQKLVKGNTNPRSYYRCSNPGCPAKKHVERAPHDSKLVITTYEGQHDHENPPGRSVTHSAAANTHTMGIDGKPGTKSGGNTAGVDTRGRSCLDSKGRLNEESITKPKADDMTEFQAISLCNEGPESKLSVQEQQNEDSGTKDNSITNDMMCHSSSKVPCRSSEHVEDKVKTTSEEIKDSLNVVAGHDAPNSISELNKQSTSDAEPIQS